MNFNELFFWMYHCYCELMTTVTDLKETKMNILKKKVNDEIIIFMNRSKEIKHRTGTVRYIF